MINIINPQCIFGIMGVVCPVAKLSPTGDTHHTDGP